MSSKFTRIIYPAIALVIILVLLFVPVASFGDGLAPSGDYKVPFFDAVVTSA